MALLSGVVRWTKLRFGRMTRRVKVFAFTLIDKDPHPVGSYGSLWWKIDHSKPLNDEEQLAKDQLDETARDLGRAIQMRPHVVIQMAYLSYAAGLLDNLPRQLRDDLYASSVAWAREKIKQLLPLASHQRERTSVKLANYALVISALAFLVSVVTLLVAVWTLVIPAASQGHY